MNTTNDTRAPATQFENQIIGGIYCTSSLIVAVAYILCMYAMYATPHIWCNQCIKLMFHLGIADMLNVVGQIIFGVITIFSATKLNCFISNTTSVSWYACVGFVNLLALNRLLAFNVYTTFNKRAADRTRLLTNVCIAIGWLHAAAFYAVFLSPITSVVYSADNWQFYYDFSYENTGRFIKAAMFISYGHLAIAGIWYIMLGVKHALAAALIFLGYWLCCIIWYNLQFLDSHWRYTRVTANLCWILTSAVNPIIYLTMNEFGHIHFHRVFVQENSTACEGNVCVLWY